VYVYARVCQREQYAITVYKSQGITLGRVLVNLGGARHGAESAAWTACACGGCAAGWSRPVLGGGSAPPRPLFPYHPPPLLPPRSPNSPSLSSRSITSLSPISRLFSDTHRDNIVDQPVQLAGSGALVGLDGQVVHGGLRVFALSDNTVLRHNNDIMNNEEYE
jgi:hypothetical protein